jgi:uncharacterized GH25 family protein
MRITLARKSVSVRIICRITALVAVLATCGCGKSPPPAVSSAVPSLTKTVKGQVIGPVGRPVAGARVIVSQGRGSFDYTELKTDGEGRFEITLEAAPYWSDVAWCCVYADGLAVGGGRLSEGENLVVLRTPRELSGTVVDVYGRPVPEAVVRLEQLSPLDRLQDSYRVPPLLADSFTAKTDEGGRWTIHGVPPFGSGWMSLDSPGMVQETKQVRFTAGGNMSTTLVAQPGTSLSGRVVYEDGGPAAGVAVMAQAQNLEAAGPGWAEAVTTADGTYRLTGLSDGVFNVLVEEPSGEWVAAAFESVKVGAQMIIGLPDLVLTSGAIIEGTVTDLTTGEPLSGVSIGSYGPHRPMSSAAIISDYTDEHGRYQLRVAPGHSYIYVAGPAPAYAMDEGHTLDVGPADTAVVDFAVGPESPRGNKGWWPF